MLQEGRVLVEGTPEEIKGNAAVQEAYLGGVHGAMRIDMSLLEVSGLNSYYGDSHILFDVALRVEKNEVVALLGRNGAGKSTTLKSLMGVVTPRAGLSRCSTASISPARRATPSRRPACSWCTRTGASSAASTSRRTSSSPA